MTKIIGSLLALLLISGCGDSTTEEATPSSKPKVVKDPVVTDPEDEECSWYNPFCSDEAEAIVTEQALTARLTDAALEADSAADFAVEGLDMAVGYVIDEYFPSFMSGMMHDSRTASDGYLNPANLVESSTTLYDYMIDFYDAAVALVSAPQLRAVQLRAEEISIIEMIINEIYNIIMGWFWPSDEPEVPVYIDPSDMIDPSIAVDFNSVGLDLRSQIFYVASSTYMTITMDAEMQTGRGEIGFGIGADFTYSVKSDGNVSLYMDGDYTIEMDYYDPDYCIAVRMFDHETGILHDAYWFSDEDVYDDASNVKKAETLCFIRRLGYSAPVVATDGVLEPIKDERAGHAPVAGSTTADMVNQLINGVARTADVTDAKYFARKMRHGIFSIYTTNGQTDTLQATETEKVMRELLPLAASSGTGMADLMTGAYDSSIAFQEEVNIDLNDSITEVNGRLDALIVATSQAMDRTTSDTGYHGVSNTTSYGDIVEFKAENIDLSIRALFSNSVDADIVMTVSNPADNGRTADILLQTHITTNVIGESVIEFKQVDSAQSVNYVSAAEYRLDVTNFKYERQQGLMTINGFGWMGSDSTSKLLFDNYEVLATFEEEPEIALLKFSATVDGSITTQSGRSFVGVLVFDGDNTSNSKMDGILNGINSEPKIEGVIKTSLNYAEMESWYNDNGSNGDLNNIGDQSYYMNVNIDKSDKHVGVDMLVLRDDTQDLWNYTLKDLNVSDQYGTLSAQSVYVVQNGVSTILETLDKVALSGMNLDSDINALINLGWDVASDFNKIGIEGLQVVMQPESGDVNINTTVHVENLGGTMSADMVATYDYAETHLTTEGDFTTEVDTSSGSNTYSNTFTTKGAIQVDNVFNYLYELEYTDDVQYILFTREDSIYQMGFILRDSEITGGDSYGVLADFTMNTEYDILESMRIYNTEDTELGHYQRADNALQVIFSDEVKEYLYLY